MIIATLATLVLLTPATLAKTPLEHPPEASNLLILLVGEADFEFDLVWVEGEMGDPVTPSTIGRDGMRLAACEDLVSGMEHWTAFEHIECVDYYEIEEVKRHLASSDPADVPEEIAEADYLLVVQDLEISLRGFFIGETHTVGNYRERLRIGCNHVFWDKHGSRAVDTGSHVASRFGKPPSLLGMAMGKTWERLDWRDVMDPVTRSITRGSPFHDRQKVEVDKRYKGLD
jgi:hypothetical protein